MSKFIDRLNRLSRGEPQAIGFTARQTAPSKPKIQLVACLAADNAESLTGHMAGADAGLLSISKLASGAETLRKFSQSQPDIIWGGWLKGRNNGDMKQLNMAGCDFVVFSAVDTPLTTLKNKKETGKILEVEASHSEGMLRTCNELLVDAVLIAVEEKESFVLTWQQLMLFQRSADLLTKPLLVLVPSTVTAPELEVLWEAGVTAVVIEITAKQPENRLMELRQEIDKIEFSSRRSKRGGVLVPRVSQPGRTTTQEDEEEDE